MGNKLNFKKHFDKAKDQGLINDEDTSVIFYDLGLLSQNLEQLKTLFPENCLHTVAIKTNPLRKVLNAIGWQGMGHEAASAGEVILAGENSKGWIVYDGPAKTAHELEKLLKYNDRLLVNANSFRDLQKILTFPFENVGLRVNTHVSTGVDARYDVSNTQSKFGIPLTERKEIIHAFVDYPELNALHFHLGSGITSAAPFKVALESIRELLGEIEHSRNEAGVEKPLQYLDIGGGLLAEKEAGSYHRWQELGQLLSTKFSDLVEKYTLVTEFGQYVHTHASWLYTEIADLLTHASRKILVLHQGANMFVRQAYTDQSPPFKYYQFDHPQAARSTSYDLAGPLCFSGDYIAKDVAFPELFPDDKLVIDAIGANTYSLWSQHCSFPFPKVIGYTGEEYTVLKEREGLGDIGVRW